MRYYFDDLNDLVYQLEKYVDDQIDAATEDLREENAELLAALEDGDNDHEKLV